MQKPMPNFSGRIAAAGLALAVVCLTSSPALGGTSRTEPGADQVRVHKRNHRHLQQKRRQPKPHSAYWGAWIGDQLTGTQPPWEMSAVSAFAGLVGKDLSLVEFSSPFADCSVSPCSFYDFPADAMENVRAYGAIPFFGWASQANSPDPAGATVMPDFQLADVIAGTYDSYIRQFAEAARNWGHPFFLRFDWEMNGNWFPWSESVNGNNAGEFVAAWRHVHDIFSSAGATNATWVWCPYAEADRRFAPLQPLYPGNQYVDWTCIDGFNWGSNPANPHKWRSFNQIFAVTYRRLIERIAPDKPIVLAELASTGRGRPKARWIRNMFKQLATRYRRVRALIWFDQVDRGVNWPLETSAAATRAFARGIRNKRFKANGNAAVSASPIRPPD